MFSHPLGEVLSLVMIPNWVIFLSNTLHIYHTNTHLVEIAVPVMNADDARTFTDSKIWYLMDEVYM